MRPIRLISVLIAFAPLSLLASGTTKTYRLPRPIVEPTAPLTQNGLTLLNLPVVLAELRVTDTEKIGVQKALTELANSEANIVDQSGVDDKISQLEAKCCKDLESTLSPSESARWGQLTAQALGIDAFRVLEVQKALAPSAAQEKTWAATLATFDGLNDSYQAKLSAKIEAIPTPADDDSAAQANYEKRVKLAQKELVGDQEMIDDSEQKLIESVIATFTPAQAEKWAKIVGKPLDLSQLHAKR